MAENNEQISLYMDINCTHGAMLHEYLGDNTCKEQLCLTSSRFVCKLWKVEHWCVSLWQGGVKEEWLVGIVVYECFSIVDEAACQVAEVDGLLNNRGILVEEAGRSFCLVHMHLKKMKGSDF